MKTLFLTTAMVLTCSVSLWAQTPKGVVLDACETVTGWSNFNQLTIDNTDFKEGKGALKTEGTSPFRYRKVLSEPLNTGLDGKPGYMSFWLYFSDVTEVNANPGVVIISSSGRAESNAHGFLFKDQVFKKGWNKVNFQLTETSLRGGAFDDTKLNYFVLIQKATAPLVVKIDNIRFVKDLKDI